MGNKRTIRVYESVEVEVDVDCDIDFEEYKKEFFAAATDKELLQECKKRHLLKDNDLAGNFTGNDTFRRYLCDLLGLSYHASKESIIEQIKANL